MSFFMWLSILFSMSTSNVLWNYTEIEVPLYGDFKSALSEIEAELYIDGLWIEDARVIYRIDGVERTFLSTINTSIVKTYTHKIEAYFPDYDIRHIITINIKIIDDIPPVIVSVPSIKIRIGDKMPNLLIGFKAYDNYDSEESLDIKIDTSQVMDTKIGTYPITYHVEDLSGNESEKTIFVDFYDDIPPDVTSLKPLKHNVDDIFSWQDYFLITDNYDSFPLIFIDSINLEHKIIGIHPFILMVTDQSGNQNTIITTIEIFDQTPPELIISSERPDIPFESNNSMSILKRLILKVADNVDLLTIDDVEIMSSVNEAMIGTYLVTYQIFDASHNKTSIDIYMKVTDQEKPVIDIIKPLRFHVFDSNPLFHEYIRIEDNVSKVENIKIEFIGTYQMDKIGKYMLTIKATDEAKNEAILSAYLEVIDLTTPKIILTQDIFITQFKPINYIPYFEISDPYDDMGDLIIVIDDFEVDYQKVGVYPLFITIIDLSNNQSSIIVDVIVMDIEPPNLTLNTQNPIEYPYGGAEIDFLSYILEVDDNHDTLSKEDVLIFGEVDLFQFGWYQMVYELSDDTGNKTTQTLDFIIVDHESPVIFFEDISIYQYEIFNVMEGVKTNDNTYISDVLTYPKSIDSSIPGSVIVTYIVMDQRGNYTIKNRLITILAVEDKPSIKQYIPVISIVFMGLSLSIFLYFKDVKHMF